MVMGVQTPIHRAGAAKGQPGDPGLQNCPHHGSEFGDHPFHLSTQHAQYPSWRNKLRQEIVAAFCLLQARTPVCRGDELAWGSGRQPESTPHPQCDFTNPSTANFLKMSELTFLCPPLKLNLFPIPRVIQPSLEHQLNY
ncbi:hypothetical protein SKAU_G00168340 [Synaphobranchus kaupii]|uniref:Uncharacterized protein n=1 Tax=Synaphobranchus kaupii TaxID=118154 RepID=A0A9Q1FKC4_SYNKA|nr:hypothetical protein SKAU_G00168340 [Synaphobranchus kaupii]